MLAAILFDAGDILYVRRRQRPAVRAFLARHGLPAPVFDTPPLLALRRQAFAGRISRDAFFDAVLGQCGLSDPALLAEGRRLLAASQAEIDFVPGLAATLGRLKQGGLKLGVVTNTFEPTATKRQWLRQAGIADLWDSFATSCELGVLKPEPAIYRAALDPLGVDPTRAAFVGHAQAELDGARRLGMTTIAFNRDSDSVSADHVVPDFAGIVAAVGCAGR